MRIDNSSKFWFLLLLLLLVANSVMPITADEAYYLTWTKQLSWGYFDHPPLVAWWAQFSREFSPRSPFILLLLLTLFVARKKQLYPLLLATPGAHLLIGGVLPDTLMIASGFFLLWRFKKWEQEDNFINAVLLGLGIGLLGLAKYHGILLIVALATGFWSLRKRGSLYLAIFVGMLIITPHLWWQYEHEWVSFRYHLSGRFIAGKPWYATLGLISGLLILWWPLLVVFKRLPIWSRTLAILTVSMMVWAGLRGSVEVHWSLVLLWIIPEVRLAQVNFAKFLERFIPPLAIALGVAHLFLVLPWVQGEFGLDEHFRKEVAEVDEQLPVVFLDSYQDAALYEFYFDRPSYSLMHPGIRLSQYNLGEYPFEGDTVAIYNRMSMGHRVEGTPFYRMERVVHDLSDLEIEVGPQLVRAAQEVPAGYRWVVYAFSGREMIEREELGPGNRPVKLPEMQEGVDRFITLEKRWVPSQLWVKLD